MQMRLYKDELCISYYVIIFIVNTIKENYRSNIIYNIQNLLNLNIIFTYNKQYCKLLTFNNRTSFK